MQLHKKDPTKVCEFNIQDLKIKDRCDAVALHISERARARSLVELLEQARVNIREGIDPQLLIEESRLRSQIDVQEKRRLELASKEETKAQAARLNKEIENLLSQYRDLQTKR
ncbi:hypothetical protein [Nostoc sp.]|uniref:hypothetical protein n=1 Tax=Nostoc sp. TaxID=1180 RepID=UPI002FF4F63F